MIMRGELINVQKHLIFAAGLMLIGVTAAFATPVVTVQPGALGSGQTFTASISISGVADLYAFQFDLLFSPQVLAATSVTEGGFLATGGATFFIPGTIDNSAGTISFTADSLLGNGGASGSGVLANVTFRGIGQGASQIALLNVQFLDSTLSQIVVTTVNGQSPQITPEPRSFLLGFSGLAMLLLGSLRNMLSVRR